MKSPALRARPPVSTGSPFSLRGQLIPALLLGMLASCASLEFERTTQTSGTFSATGVSVTILNIDLPKSAMQIARENLADSNLANMRIDQARVIPDLGWWNWVLDILSIRMARVSGKWGFEGDSQSDGD